MRSRILSLWLTLAAIAPGSAKPATHEEYSPAVIDKLVEVLDAIEATNTRVALSYKKLLKKKIAVERPKSGFARDCIDAWGFIYGPAVGLRSKEDGAMSILFYYGERDESKYLQLDQLHAESPKQFLIIKEKNGSPVYTNSTNLKEVADFLVKAPALEIVELPTHSTLAMTIATAFMGGIALCAGGGAVYSFILGTRFHMPELKSGALALGILCSIYAPLTKYIYDQRYENVQAAHQNLRKLFRQVKEADPA